MLADHHLSSHGRRKTWQSITKKRISFPSTKIKSSIFLNLWSITILPNFLGSWTPIFRNMYWSSLAVIAQRLPSFHQAFMTMAAEIKNRMGPATDSNPKPSVKIDSHSTPIGKQSGGCCWGGERAPDTPSRPFIFCLSSAFFWRSLRAEAPRHLEMLSWVKYWISLDLVFFFFFVCKMKKFATQVVGEIKLGSLQTFNCPLAYHFYNILSLLKSRPMHLICHSVK